MHSGPITLLDPLVVLIGRHKDYAREKISNENGKRVTLARHDVLVIENCL